MSQLGRQKQTSSGEWCPLCAQHRTFAEAIVTSALCPYRAFSSLDRQRGEQSGRVPHVRGAEPFGKLVKNRPKKGREFDPRAHVRRDRKIRSMLKRIVLPKTA